jgi:hypothetical protein
MSSWDVQALWAIPDITDSATRNPFVITAVFVGLLTYLIVFNLENIASRVGGTFRKRRETLLEEMRDDPNTIWKSRRAAFEMFPPPADRKTPSEWWLVWYQIQKTFQHTRAKEQSEEHKVDV